MRFLGNIEAKTDAKGRVFLPAVFRKVLQTEGVEQLVIRKDVHEKCLVLYPETVWVEQMESMRSRLNRWNRQHQQIFRQYVSEVESVVLDANGRFLLSKRLLEVAGIDQMVRFIGVGNTIEIWAVTDDDKPFMAEEDFGKALESIMGKDDNIAF
jgi:MraZ protein